MRPLLLGMNNPLSDDPKYDLYPYPEGSTGWRLWKMLPDGTSRVRYLAAFERLNLLRARAWSAAAAHAAGQEVLPRLAGRLVIVLGSEVRAALGLPRAEPLVRQKTAIAGSRFFTLEWIPMPHPSGRNCWFNEPANYEGARRVLAELMSGDAA